MKQENTQTENSKKKFDEVKTIVWNCCNIFRGTMDAANYKDFILHMLFLKYISDKFEEDLRRESEDIDGSDKRKMDIIRENLDFNIPETATFDAIYRQKNNSKVSLGSIIDEAFAEIESANKTKLAGVFQGIKFNNPNMFGDSINPILAKLLEEFKRLDLRPSQGMGDIIGDVYMYLIGKFASDAGKKAGEFYTPQAISHLLAKLAQPSKGDHICDPACGSGGLLLEAAQATGAAKKANLYGMEKNSSTWALCKLNMFLHNYSGQNIKKCDTLRKPDLLDGDKLRKFDTVVANPPFSLKDWGMEDAEHDVFSRFHRGVPPNKAADWAFITHMIETAKPKKGRVAVITPHGVLFRGAAEGRIRTAFIEENLIDAVIGLSPNLFQTTSIPVVIIIFDRQREKGCSKEALDNILFIDAKSEHVPGRNQNSIGDQHINKIVETYQKRQDIKRYSRKVPLKEIKENDYTLNISRYIDTFPEEEKVDITKVQAEIEQLESELSKVQKQMKEHLKKIV